jgi:CheY-like chemotaxis protein
MGPRGESGHIMGAVLVVDDDAEIRRFLCDLLESEGYTVLSACDGREALEVLRATREPLVVMLDLMMPVLDGYQVLSELERDPGSRTGRKVIVMSASERLLSGEFPRADALLPKPFELLDLLDLVDILCVQLSRGEPPPDGELSPPA